MVKNTKKSIKELNNFCTTTNSKVVYKKKRYFLMEDEKGIYELEVKPK